MAGNKAGGVKAAETNVKRHGEDFYRTIGAKGGKVKVPKGFAVTGKAAEAGRIGGTRSKRTPRNPEAVSNDS